MTHDNALKPCPCCKSDARTLRQKGITGKVCQSQWYRERTACTNKKCSITTPEFKRPGQPAALWNTRAKSDERVVSPEDAIAALEILQGKIGGKSEQTIRALLEHATEETNQ